MTVKLLTEHHLEFLSLKGGCTDSSESALIKMPHCWKSNVMAHILYKISVFFDTPTLVAAETATVLGATFRLL